MAAEGAANHRLILASASPRRRELLGRLSVGFESLPVEVDERALAGESADGYVQRLALEKARAGLEQRPSSLVLGSDTAVVLGERILGKPRDRADAVQMLLALSGQAHEVLTGVALVGPTADAQHYRLSRSQVRFRAISQAEAEAYWASGEPVDKAGGYAIQGLGAQFVSDLRGSYSGVMGLPLFETAELLRLAGIEPLSQQAPLSP